MKNLAATSHLTNGFLLYLEPFTKSKTHKTLTPFSSKTTDSGTRNRYPNPNPNPLPEAHTHRPFPAFRPCTHQRLQELSFADSGGDPLLLRHFKDSKRARFVRYSHNGFGFSVSWS
ncbi:hypothetical protein ACFX13_031662 [Malus domestica]